jgi:hypothetical protein
VGVFVKKNPDGTWTTADAGQGPRDKQEAKYLTRVYALQPDGKATLSTIVNGQKTLPRNLTGWVDLDKVPPASASVTKAA